MDNCTKLTFVGARLGEAFLTNEIKRRKTGQQMTLNAATSENARNTGGVGVQQEDEHSGY